MFVDINFEHLTGWISITLNLFLNQSKLCNYISYALIFPLSFSFKISIK